MATPTNTAKATNNFERLMRTPCRHQNCPVLKRTKLPTVGVLQHAEQFSSSCGCQLAASQSRILLRERRWPPRSIEKPVIVQLAPVVGPLGTDLASDRTHTAGEPTNTWVHDPSPPSFGLPGADRRNSVASRRNAIRRMRELKQPNEQRVAPEPAAALGTLLFRTRHPAIKRAA